MPQYSYQLYQMVSHAPGTTTWQPRIDISRGAHHLLIAVEAPGLEHDHFNLHFEPGQLLIEGRRRRPAMPECVQCLQVEIEYGYFRRIVALPPEADGDKITAHYEAGILRIEVPFRTLEAPRDFRINVA